MGIHTKNRKRRKRRYTNVEKLAELKHKWKHLNTDPHASHILSASKNDKPGGGSEGGKNDEKRSKAPTARKRPLTVAETAYWKDDWDIDGLNEAVKVLPITVFPLVPLGIVWQPVKKNLQKVGTDQLKGSLEHKYVAKIKKLKGSTCQAALAQLGPGDYLRSINGQPVVAMDLTKVKELLRGLKMVGEPYQCEFVRKLHVLKQRIHDDTRKNMEMNRSSITTRDKFIASLVTMMYLLYPTVTRAAFQLVACQKVGAKLYLQMDLDVPCYEPEHMFWVMNLAFPSMLGYVIGLPVVTLLILLPRRHDLNNRWTKFRFGVLFSGYTEQ